MDGYSFECSMCGKPMAYRFCGMCTSCETIDNEVPESDLGHWQYISKPCPECGGRLQERSKDYGDIGQVEHMCDDCDYADVYYE